MQKRAVDERKHIEREYDAGTRKLYVLVFPYEEEIWIDTEALPESTFFCAAFDGISIKKCKVIIKHLKALWIFMLFAL